MTKFLLHYEDFTATDCEVDEREKQREAIEERPSKFPVGSRVKLVGLAQNVREDGDLGYDDRPNLPPGTCGTVVGLPDACGSLPVKWDNGSSLAATATDELQPR